MCGRFTQGNLTQAQLLDVMRGFLDGPAEADTDAPSAVTGWNIKPTQQVHMVYARDDDYFASTGRWWFVPHWHKDDVKDWKATTFNAKLETAREKPTFRVAWKAGRCLVPATGYYEWTGPKGKKQPWFIRPDTNAELIFFAGLKSTLKNGLNTCTILTRAAAPALTDIHPRMPVILRESECQDWLTAAEDDAQVVEDLGTDWSYRTHKVAPFGMKDDGSELIEPIEN